MSLSRAQQARLGTFLSIGVFLTLLLISIPLGLKLNNKYKNFIAYFTGESLSGLEQGAIVKFNGVPIGKVEKIKYLPNDLLRVRVEMKIQDDFPVKVDMSATSSSMGITGLKYIEITGGTDSAAFLKPGSEIPTKKSMFSTITGKAEVIMAKVELLLNNLNEISNPDSLRSIKETLGNIEAISADVKAFIRESGPQVNRLASSTAGIITNVDSIVADVKLVLGDFSSNVPIEKVGSIINKVDSTTLALKTLSEDLSLMVRQTREDFTASMKNVRDASENSSELTKTLAENPSLLLRNETQRERILR